MGGAQSSTMDSYRAIDCYRVLQATYPVFSTFPVQAETKKGSKSLQKRCCSLLPSAAYSVEEDSHLQAIKAPFTACNIPSVQLLLEPHLIQRPCWPITPLDILRDKGRGLFSSKKGCCQQLHPFVSLHPPFGTYFFDVDKLTDIHVIISVLDVRPYSLNYLAHHRHNDIPPGQ